MKTILLTIILVLIIGNIFAQTTDAEKSLQTQNKDTLVGWKVGGITSLNLTQTSLNNWSAGGQNAVSATGILIPFLPLI